MEGWYIKIWAEGLRIPVETRGPYQSRVYAEEKAKQHAADLRDKHPQNHYTYELFQA